MSKLALQDYVKAKKEIKSPDGILRAHHHETIPLEFHFLPLTGKMKDFFSP